VNEFSFANSNSFAKQNLAWYGVFTTININEKIYLQNEIQQRHFISPLEQHQFLVRIHLHRKLTSSWEYSAGMCLMLQNIKSQKNNSVLTVPELRPHIELANSQIIGNRIKIDNRYRAEARFFHNTNNSNTQLEDGFDFSNYRFRYRFQISFNALNFKENRKMNLKFSNEILLNAGKKILNNIFDQNRIYAGVSFHNSEKLTLDVGYMNWFQQNSTYNFVSRNIIRLTIFHKINISKKK
jgi:hypothetical protein